MAPVFTYILSKFKPKLKLVAKRRQAQGPAASFNAQDQTHRPADKR